jgi:hypothetical protein
VVVVAYKGKGSRNDYQRYAYGRVLHGTHQETQCWYLCAVGAARLKGAGPNVDGECPDEEEARPTTVVSVNEGGTGWEEQTD